MEFKWKLKRFLALILTAALFLGLFPADRKVAQAKTATVSLTCLGRKGTVDFGPKSKSGKWWQMHIDGKKAFCMDLGDTCHSGNTYASEETHKWDQDTGGEKEGHFAKIIRWYVVDRERSNKAYVMAQALIWSVEQGRSSEAQLKDVIRQVKQNTGISPAKTAKEMYGQIFGHAGNFTAELTFWKKTGNSSSYQRLMTVDAEEKAPRNYVPKVMSDSSLYRQRITVQKKDESGNPVGGVQFTLRAKDMDELYSFSVTDRNGSESVTAEEDNDTKFSLTGTTTDGGRIAFRMTYRIFTMGYYYYKEEDLAAMSSAEKKEARKYLREKLDLDEGVEFPSDLTRASAKKMMDREMKELKAAIKNTYILKEDSVGNNKHLTIHPAYVLSVKLDGGSSGTLYGGVF